MVRKVTWPHEVVYTSDGKPAASKDISVPLFVQGYLINMDSCNSSVKHRMDEYLKDLMSDAEMYGWDRTHAFHGVWMNQIEQSRHTWLDDEEKLKFHRVLV